MQRSCLLMGAITVAGLIAAAMWTLACCPAPPSGKPVLNANQSVIIVWDAARKMQHFIRKATFHSEADDFGFIVPTPTQPELAESGDDSFDHLRKITEPVKRRVFYPRMMFGCKKPSGRVAGEGVSVLDEKDVAGFKAVVLKASSAAALVAWLEKNGYAFSPQIEAWAEPYIKQGWKMTALKIAKAAPNMADNNVAAAALRLSFATDRPLFPYREPDPTSFAQALGVGGRLLRIYFIAESRYRGQLGDEAWNTQVAWANKLSPEARARALDLLKLPASTGPKEWWLTEFENNWPYSIAPADIYFERDVDQSVVAREPIVEYVSSIVPVDCAGLCLIVFLGVLLVRMLFRWLGPTSVGSP